MGLVTAFCPLTMTGDGKFVFQTTGGARLLADCNETPASGVGQFTITFVPEEMMANCGGNSVRLNTVPLPALPPFRVVP